MTEARLTLGAWGEEQAVAYLKRLGAKVLQRNRTTPVGEIDILARHRKLLLFVEVKTRSSHRYGSPAEAVGPRKQRQIIRAAQWILAEERSLARLQPRFDVISVMPVEAGPPRIDHLENAFGADGAE